MNVWDEIKRSFQAGSSLMKLIYINTALFIVWVTLILFSKLSGVDVFNPVNDQMAIPSNLYELMLKPWTIISYMFWHGGFMHVFFNMLILYWFGILALQMFDEKKLLGIYFLGGILGAILYLLVYNLSPGLSHTYMVGASGSVFAVVFATSFYQPQRQMHLIFIGPVKILYIAIGMLAISFFRDSVDNVGGFFAHAGGALFGYLYAVNYRKGRDISKGFNQFMSNLFTLFRSSGGIRGSKVRVKHKKSKTDWEYNKAQADNQKEIDRILEKIKKGGYDSLTKNEKETLFRASQK